MVINVDGVHSKHYYAGSQHIVSTKSPDFVQLSDNIFREDFVLLSNNIFREDFVERVSENK